MCGIVLIVSGIRINLSSLLPDFTTSISSPEISHQLFFNVEDAKAAIARRGPDSVGFKNVFLYPNISSVVSFIEGEEGLTKRDSNSYFASSSSCGKLQFIGATLQLRGTSPITQPLVDSSGNILVYNGEIFGGLHFSSDSNDAEILMQSLGKCCSCNSHEHTKECSCSGEGPSSVPELLSTIKGPWALIYWQESSKTMWFGKDAFGRRSLLVHWPTSRDPRLLLTSVLPVSSISESSDCEPNSWEELQCGVYSLSTHASKVDGYLVGEVRYHDWTTPMLKELVKWERSSVEPIPEQLNISQTNINILSSQAVAVLTALRKSVMRRSVVNKIDQASAPVAVLFSGGLDSMILTALLDECLDTKYEIDLLNVSFDGQFAPDRISATAGLKELQRLAPLRSWKLVEIDADLLKLTSETKHVMSLINPAKTYMDLNIGIALWLAAGGNGWVNEAGGNQRVSYKSEARILLVGSGADEQCAGYGRHKTKFRQGSWSRLHEEMKLDMHRIWKRNLGRDDRCISDNGKEARFPFLDEDVIRTLLDIPLWEIADLDQPSGIGDKKILREVSRLLGLYEAALLPKRAIQFGSRIARESNRKNFGSNSAANQASAGSVVIYKP